MNDKKTYVENIGVPLFISFVLFLFFINYEIYSIIDFTGIKINE